MTQAVHFESLGDNCEFGFVQRFQDVESSGLLRWAVSYPDTLIQGISNSFEDIYHFESLKPINPRMVIDTRTDFKFHTQMESRDLTFLLGETERREIHAREYEKITYLRSKLLESFKSGDKHFVYKHNRGISPDQARRLGEAIASHGPGKILVVHQADDRKTAGEVEKMTDNLYFGYLEAFADYGTANQVDLIGWNALLENAIHKMGQPKSAA